MPGFEERVMVEGCKELRKSKLIEKEQMTIMSMIETREKRKGMARNKQETR